MNLGQLITSISVFGIIAERAYLLYKRLRRRWWKHYCICNHCGAEWKSIAFALDGNHCPECGSGKVEAISYGDKEHHRGIA